MGQVKQENNNVSLSLFEGISNEEPSWASALKIQSEVRALGFDWPDFKGALAKVVEETQELDEAHDTGDRDKVEEEYGDLLFAVLKCGHYLNLDPEKALKRANEKFMKRFLCMLQEAQTQGLEPQGLSLDAWMALWRRAKKQL